MNDNNGLKFPSIIREKLRKGEFVFPENTRFMYPPVLAYRMIYSAVGKGLGSYIAIDCCKEDV